MQTPLMQVCPILHRVPPQVQTLLLQLGFCVGQSALELQSELELQSGLGLV